MIGLSEIQDLQNPFLAIDSSDFTGGMFVDVQRPDIGTKFNKELDAVLVAAKGREVQGRVAKMISLVGIASGKKSIIPCALVPIFPVMQRRAVLRDSQSADWKKWRLILCFAVALSNLSSFPISRSSSADS